MPRRGSRAQLVHLLADLDARAWREVYGDRYVYPQDFYESYRRCSIAELWELAVSLTPNRRGRPKSWRSRSRYQALVAKVDRVLARNVHLSVRSACSIVANRARTSPEMLRKLYRAKR
jgi:hypothetical protein